MTRGEAINLLETIVGFEDVFTAAEHLPSKDDINKLEVELAALRHRKASQIDPKTPLLDFYAGKIVGMEIKHRSHDSYALILADASTPGAYRIQRFDSRGFYGHSTFNSPDEALQGAVYEGFHIPAKGALDRLAGTSEWLAGMAATYRAQESWKAV